MLPRIALANVNLHLGGRLVLRDITWTLEPGTHWAFAGANGSGKSSLLRVIAGTQWIDDDGGSRSYSPDGARRDFLGRASTWIRLVSAEQHEHYARLDLAVPARTIVESGFDGSLYVHRPPAAPEAARGQALLRRFGLDALADRPIRELSSGQLRRMLIARALAGKPRVLILDEFTNGLDEAARRATLAFLDEIAPEVTLLIASHRPADFPAAITHTMTLRDGRIAAIALGRPAVAASPSGAVWPKAATADTISLSATATRDGSPAADAAASGPPPGVLRSAPVLVDIQHADVYRGDVLVLRDVNWQVRAGEHTAIRGANGSGKSTFAGLLAGTIPAATGARVARFGRAGPVDLWQLKARIAHVSDDVQIAYDLREPVESVIASGFAASIGLFFAPTDEQRRTVDGLIERIGIDSLRGRPFTELSFGERRKVLVARSLVRRPQILILDEISNGLDAAFRAALSGLLMELAAAGTTLVAIVHDDDDVPALMTRVCTIANGRLVERQTDAFASSVRE